MSTAALVPETSERHGDRAWATLVQAGRRRLLVDAFLRLRVSDGFTHARSLALMTALVAVQGLVAVIGVANAVGGEGVGLAAGRIARSVAPGLVGDALLTAIEEARANGGTGRYVAIAVGLLGALVSGTTAMGQLQRSLNRLYGLEQDRPTLEKYGLAVGLALSAGVLMTGAFGAIAFGDAIGDAIGDNALTPIWGVGRIALALSALTGGVALLLRVCPRRQQPSWSWLAPGASVAVAAWALATVGLGAALAMSPSFGDAYGPLAGVVALLLWALLSSIALLYGAAIAAELEAVRAATPGPQDPAKLDSPPAGHRSTVAAGLMANAPPTRWQRRPPSRRSSRVNRPRR